MIPRFNYSFPFSRAWIAIKSLFKNECSNKAYYEELFPAATVFELRSARQGLTYALEVLNLPGMARVGVQPYTCSSVMLAIQAAGCVPVFIDINYTLTLDCHDLEKKIGTLDALIITHTFGIPADISRIKAVVGSLPVIEDCAHAFLCNFEGVQLGNFFDMSVFSFGNGKFPALGSGGLLVINTKKYEPKLRDRVSRLQKTTLLEEIQFIIRQFVYSLLYSRLGYQLEYNLFDTYFVHRGKQISINQTQEKRIYTSVQYMIQAGVDKFPTFALLQKQNALAIIGQHQEEYEILLNEDIHSNCFTIVFLHDHRDDFYQYLKKRGIGAGLHFQFARIWASSYGYQTGDCPTFEFLVERIVTIPCTYSVTV